MASGDRGKADSVVATDLPKQYASKQPGSGAQCYRVSGATEIHQKLLIAPINYYPTKKGQIYPKSMTAAPRNFYMRDGVLADVHRLADIGAHAFIDDNLYDVLFPKRREFFEDYHYSWELRLRSEFLQPGVIYKVVEIDVEESGHVRREIVGWAAWLRMGSSRAAKKINQERETLLRRLEYMLITLEVNYLLPVLQRLRRIPEDRSTDPVALKKFEEEYPKHLENIFGNEYEEHWHLQMLAIDPKWQRKGIGQMLVKWGLEKARNESVLAGLEASDMGFPMYLRLGFEEIGRFQAPKDGLSFPALIWRSDFNRRLS